MWIAPTGLLFSAAGRQYRQRPLLGGVCDRGGGFCPCGQKAPVGPATFIPRCWPQHCLTSAKLSNLPLLLPWALALLASIKLIFRWPVRTVVVSALAVSASLLPTLV